MSRDPDAETGQPRAGMAIVNWTRYRKCPVCHALIGAACFNLSGAWLGDRLVSAVEVPADRPHASRKLRTVAP